MLFPNESVFEIDYQAGTRILTMLHEIGHETSGFKPTGDNLNMVYASIPDTQKPAYLSLLRNPRVKLLSVRQEGMNPAFYGLRANAKISGFSAMIVSGCVNTVKISANAYSAIKEIIEYACYALYNQYALFPDLNPVKLFQTIKKITSLSDSRACDCDDLEFILNVVYAISQERALEIVKNLFIDAVDNTRLNG